MLKFNSIFKQKNNKEYFFENFNIQKIFKKFKWLGKLIPATKVQVKGDGFPSGATAQVFAGNHWNFLSEEPESTKRNERSFKGDVLLLKEENFLLRPLTIPLSAMGSVESMAELEAQSATPFSWEKTVWSYFLGDAIKKSNSDSNVKFFVILTSKDIIEREVENYYGPEFKSTDIEVWAQTNDKFINLLGFGEKKRFSSEQRSVVMLCLSMTVSVILAGALMLTPTLQLRYRALDAIQKFDLLGQSMGAPMAQRQQLTIAAQETLDLQKKWDTQISPVHVFAALTRIFPDDTAIHRLEINGNKLAVQGITSNASHILQLISQEPGFLNVKLPNAVNRIGATSNETFTLESDIDPKFFGLFENSLSSDPKKIQ